MKSRLSITILLIALLLAAIALPAAAAPPAKPPLLTVTYSYFKIVSSSTNTDSIMADVRIRNDSGIDLDNAKVEIKYLDLKTRNCVARETSDTGPLPKGATCNLPCTVHLTAPTAARATGSPYGLAVTTLSASQTASSPAQPPLEVLKITWVRSLNQRMPRTPTEAASMTQKKMQVSILIRNNLTVRLDNLMLSVSYYDLKKNQVLDTELLICGSLAPGATWLARGSLDVVCPISEQSPKDVSVKLDKLEATKSNQKGDKLEVVID